MFPPPLLLAFSVLAQSSLTAAASSVTWLAPHRSAIVKLSTTSGRPSQKAGESHAADRSFASVAAVLLKFELSADNKTLLLDDAPFLPLQNYYIPPRLSASEVPDAINKDAIIAIAEGKEERNKRVQLDYDRLVDGDPTGGPPYYNHQPVLRFRLMGFGIEGTDFLLDPQEQEIVQIAMQDQNEGGWSNDAARSYTINNIEILPANKVYADLSTSLGDHMGPEADQEKECTRRNWKCPDEGVHEAGSPYRTPYRFIWRRRFDQYGRIGSLRHDFVEQWEISKQKAYDDPRNSALVALGILLATVLAIVGGVKSRANRSALVEETRKPVKKVKAERAEGEEEEEEEESEDEDAAWLGEMAQQAGEVPMTVDEASNLIDLMSDEEDLDNAAAIPASKPKSKNKNKRVAFKTEDDE